MNCGSVGSHCCSKLCTPLRGEQQATQYGRILWLRCKVKNIILPFEHMLCQFNKYRILYLLDNWRV